MRDYLADGSRRSVIVDQNILNHLIEESEGRFKYKRLPESILINHVGFVQSKTCLIFNVFDRKIVQLLESGLAQHHIRNQKFDENKFQVGSEPQVLTLNVMGDGFKLWLTCFSAAFLCFFIEIVSQFKTVLRKFKRRKKTSRRTFKKPQAPGFDSILS